jgi:hypothetical protein
VITDFFLNTFQSIVTGFINLLPLAGSNWSIDVGQYLGYANLFINMPLLMTVVGIFITYEVVILGVRLVLWIYDLIPLT